MCSLPTSCGQLQVKTSTCHHTLKGYVMSMPKARMPIVFFLSRSVHNTSLRLLQFINLRCMYYSFSESPRVKYSGLCMCTSHPLKRIKGKCSSIRLHLWCRWIFPLFTLLNSTVLHLSKMVSIRIAEPEPPLDQRSGIVKRPLNQCLISNLHALGRFCFSGDSRPTQILYCYWGS